MLAKLGRQFYVVNSNVVQGLIVCCFVCILVALVIRRRANRLRVPRIGKSPSGLFGLAKARADFLLNGRRLAEEGYAKARTFSMVTGRIR